MASKSELSSTASSSKITENSDFAPLGDTGAVHDRAATEGDDDELVEGSDEHIQKCLEDAEELKKEGTVHFKAGLWAQALATYTSALGRLPKRAVAEPAPPKSIPEPDIDVEDPIGDEDSTRSGAKEKESAPAPEPVPLTGLALDCAKARSVLNANIGACHVKLEEYKEAVKSCTEALADDPTYVKALQRRISCNEKIGSWSALGSAQEDYNTLLKILPPDSPQIGATKRALAALKPRLEDAQKKETGEVLEKLKGLGNSLLGNFGLSTDNFKFEPNGQGGYSINFSQ
ncbi:hypothetical protein M0805_004104 [Coniferiporia weirii]|nr:hypothetical protein M0805_004104 [Coniferiporia weirii]